MFISIDTVLKSLFQSSGFEVVLEFPALLFVIKCFTFLLQETIAGRDRKKKQLIKPCCKFVPNLQNMLNKRRQQ